MVADRARDNREIYRISVLLSQLCERFHRARHANGNPAFDQAEIVEIKQKLEHCREERDKLRILHAAATAMLDEACEAFGINPDV